MAPVSGGQDLWVIESKAGRLLLQEHLEKSMRALEDDRHYCFRPKPKPKGLDDIPF